MNTVRALIATGAAERPAIGAPGRTALTFGGLRTLAGATGAALHAAGLGRGDRMAIVLPNGPEAATAFLTVACHAVTAPLNPSYRPDEFEFSLSDLNARGLVVLAGMETPARDVAARMGLPVFELTPDPAGAGAFTLPPPKAPSGPITTPDPPRHDDLALVPPHLRHHRPAENRAADPCQTWWRHPGRSDERCDWGHRMCA